MSGLVACESCDLLHEEQPLEDRHNAHCVRCSGLLYRGRSRTLEITLALSIASLTLLIVANVYPFLTFTLEGQTQTNRIISGVILLWNAHYQPLALLILWASIVAPLGRVLAMLYVTAPLLAGYVPPGVPRLTRLLKTLAPWAMLDVYMLAVLATLAKLASMATITPGPGAWAFVAVMLISAGASAAFDERAVWQRLDAAKASGMPAAPLTARVSWVRCPGCDKLHPAEHTPPGAPCDRCGAPVHARKPSSVQRTWALMLGAALLYVPSNLYPVMTISQLGKVESDTIISGVIELFQAGWYPVAVAILFASILVPCLKIVSLTILLLALQRRSRWNPVTRTKLYRIVESIGRWSMLDMFTTSLLVALVQLGNVMTIEPGVGATCFAGVVILTMLAARSFDPRLVWDSLEEES